MRNLQIRRGNKANIPRFELAELGYSIDTKELHVGNGDGTYATFIDDAQLDSSINAITSELDPNEKALQRALDDKVLFDNQAIDLNLIQNALFDIIINKAQAITSPEVATDYALASDASHVFMQNGLNYEKVYTGLLKSSAKTFTSTGEPILIKNGISKQKLLGFKITGKTVSGSAATQVVLVNNGISYPFYASESDKALNKVLTLGDLDTFELLLDGTGVLIRSGVKTVVPKSLMSVIITHETNLISVDSITAPTALEVVVVVNKITENQARIEALKAQKAVLATLLTS